MKSSLFFELDEKSDLTQGMVFFQYKRIYREGQYPVSVYIGPDVLSFYWSVARGKESFENIALFQLYYSDYENPKGKFARELNQLCVWSADEKRYLTHPLSGDENNLLEYPPQTLFYSKQGNFELAYREIPQHTIKVNPSKVDSISFVTLLLDFLYDLKHSEIFTNTSHYDQFLKVLRGSYLLNALAAKAEYFYQQAALKVSPDNPIIKSEYTQAAETWLDILLNDQSPEILAGSSWFAENLECEVRKINTVALTRKSREKVVLWYLRRFDYLKGIKISKQGNKSHKWLLWWSSFMLGVCGLWLFKPLWGCIGIGAGGLILGIILWKNKRKNKRTEDLDKKINWLEWGSLLMPRLLLTLFISWTGVVALDIPQLSWKNWGLYAIVSIGLVFAYMAHEIKLYAPDVPFRIMWKRIMFLIGWALVASGVMGAIILSISLQEAVCVYGLEKVEAEIKFCPVGYYYIAFKAWASATIFVFFVGLFVNLLFSGKKFTGF